MMDLLDLNALALAEHDLLNGFYIAASIPLNGNSFKG